MRFNHIVSPTAFAVCIGGCGPDTTDDGRVDPTTGTSLETTNPSAEVTGASSIGDSSSTDPSGGSSTATATGESTTEGVFDPADCRAAVTESDCEATGETCRWRTAYRVTDLDTCTLEPAPDLQCWSSYLVSQNCAVFGPDACVPLDVAPRYREVDGELQLLDFHCALGPEDVPSDGPAWEVCRDGSEESGPVPPVCLCLCGGPIEE